MSEPFAHEDICRDLRESCGVEAGDLVIMHSSCKAIGPVAGGVGTLVRAVKEVVTQAGTLLMPVFCDPGPDGVFKIRRTPSDVGLLPEAFRRSAGVRRSMHPTHSVAGWGRRADELLDGHEKTSAIGLDSPFHKAAKAGAYVLMIGCKLSRCSLVHACEAVVRPPYLGKVIWPGYDRVLTLIDYDGNAHEFPPVDTPGDGSGFKAVQEELERRGQMRHCKVANAETLRFGAPECLQAGVELLRADPAALLCHKSKCPVCPASHKVIEESRA